MYQTVQEKHESKTKYDNGNDYVLPSRQRRDVINSQPVKQLAAAPLLDGDMRIFYRSNNSSAPQSQYNVVQLVISTAQQDFINRIKTAKDLGNEVTINVPGNSNIVECRITHKNYMAVSATKAMALLQRKIYNLFVASELAKQENQNDKVLVHYFVDYKKASESEHIKYMQEVVYSYGAKGYVTMEDNDGIKTNIVGREDLTGMPLDGAPYPAAHTYTGKDPWIALLKDGDKTNGDNGSKLTAENARFQLLMDDRGTSDDTGFLLSTTNKIICVKARNLTSNFMHVLNLRSDTGASKDELPIHNNEIANAIENSTVWEGEKVMMSNKDFLDELGDMVISKYDNINLSVIEDSKSQREKRILLHDMLTDLFCQKIRISRLVYATDFRFPSLKKFR